MQSSKSIIIFEIFSILFTLIFGTLLHFTFEKSNNNLLVASFSSTNESTWEHLKLLFFPMLFTTIIGYFLICKYYSNFFCAQAISIIVGMLFIVVFFYTYTGIIGRNFALLDIGSFVVATFLSGYISYKILVSNFLCNPCFSIFILLLLLFSFILFTYIPPKINLFRDPVTGDFGIK